MLLAVDVGNTQTVLGLFDADVLVADWRIATDPTDTADELHFKIRELFSLKDLEPLDVRELALASVVPSLTDTWNEVSQDFIDHHAFIIGPGTKTGLKINYDHPNEIGPDRIADAVAAIQNYGYPVIIVDFGTATNIEVIDEEGSFVGGIIAPGVMTSAEALFSHAARLATVDLDVPDSVIGKNTRGAVQSGLVYGEVARIDGLVYQIFDELDCEAAVVATGGLASRFAHLSNTIETVDEHLTLFGINTIFQHHRARKARRSREGDAQ